MPLDVPIFRPPVSTAPSPSIVGDSGLGGDQSYSSLSSGPPSLSLGDAPSLIGTFCDITLFIHFENGVCLQEVE